MIIGLDRILSERPNLIRDMKIGDTGYTVPWCVVILKNGDVYMNGKFDVDEGGGTASLKILRTNIGYDLDFTNVDRFDSYHKTLEECVRNCIGATIEDYIKVGNISTEFKIQSINNVKQENKD